MQTGEAIPLSAWKFSAGCVRDKTDLVYVTFMMVVLYSFPYTMRLLGG